MNDERPVRSRVLLVACAWLLAVGCVRSVRSEQGAAPLPAPSSAAPALPAADARSAALAVTSPVIADASTDAASSLSVSAELIDGPHELPLAPGRAVYYARPRDGASAGAEPGARPWRVIGHLHGICYPPSYSCGKWQGAAVARGVLVCPTGNARCGDPSVGPPSWEAPTWEELVSTMDGDLERSIAKVEAKHAGSIRRDGAILTGFSRGAYAAPVIARIHPGRWPYLVLIEANVPLSAASLRKAGVRAVALVAGETGTELAGERKTETELAQAGFPVRLFVMPRVAHVYSEDVDRIMADAFAFVLAH